MVNCRSLPVVMLPRMSFCSGFAVLGLTSRPRCRVYACLLMTVMISVLGFRALYCKTPYNRNRRVSISPDPAYNIPVSARCSQIFSADPSQPTRAPVVPELPEEQWHRRLLEMKQMLANCLLFKKTRHYQMGVLPEEDAMPLGYSILVYQDVLQAERLLRLIYRPHNYYCIHVDRKASVFIHQFVQSLSACFPNVLTSSRSVSVQWGFDSVLEADLTCLRDLWQFSDWRYFINLTGRDLPLRTNLELVKILGLLNGSNIVETVTSGQTEADKSRTRLVHIPGVGQTRQGKAPPPVDLDLVKGAVHIVITRAFADFVLHDAVAQQLREWLKDAGHSDEIFFSSLIYNKRRTFPRVYVESDHDDRRPILLSRYKEWEYYGYHCHGKWINALCVFGEADLPHLLKRKELFVNKFHASFQPLAFDCMEEWLLNRTLSFHRHHAQPDLFFYRNRLKIV